MRIDAKLKNWYTFQFSQKSIFDDWCRKEVDRSPPSTVLAVFHCLALHHLLLQGSCQVPGRAGLEVQLVHGMLANTIWPPGNGVTFAAISTVSKKWRQPAVASIYKQNPTFLWWLWLIFKKDFHFPEATNLLDFQCFSSFLLFSLIRNDYSPRFSSGVHNPMNPSKDLGGQWPRALVFR